ncbi:phosphoprotein phosphatase [Trypanosoma rangeli]|uniref:Serine/threonine-protein phosphatase n=1 Tax=Trypanosoma rangeli TaxID=5698 RepID=A0A422P483_TRYRA|nr:phosphoprotein phosphatase [Trypanosoma rangeli]RNF12547.1 phosphoprotein phosphatase [Trypanosoma rangeli]|eukprot:RNF12547.1 phosphoprotein phosphatase [Trypanosoma rangeli]
MSAVASVFYEPDVKRDTEDSDNLVYWDGEKESAQSTCDQSLPGVLYTGICSSRSNFFAAPPRKGIFLDLIDSLLHSGTASSVSQASDNPLQDETPISTGEGVQRFFTTELVGRLCDEVKAVLEGEKVLLNIQVEQNETLVVVGDIHGHFNDLIYHILPEQSDKKLNFDGSDRKFLFMGDFVDRGPCGVEVVMLLFALKVEYPQLIYMLRGNHEDPHISSIYGFFNEVRAKFGCDAPWVCFNEVFRYLPLAAVVTTPRIRFFATHGGLSPPLLESFDIIKTIERLDYGGALDSVLSEVVGGLLWSDPTDMTEYFARNMRGCGYMFGPQASQKFCQMNQFDFICRAHQVVSEGYEWCHDNKALTVFSVPNYCGFSENLGAIMIVQVLGSDEEKEELRFKQFSSAAEVDEYLPYLVKTCGEFVFSAFMD